MEINTENPMEKIIGITAEYDPFHRGHAYQIARAREETCADAVVCAMSGDFTQRGEPAVLDKWTRAKIAVQQGADLVFELPFRYACNRAEHFASGAVDLLMSAGASHISFGCEAEHPEDLQKLADAQLTREDQVRIRIRERMEEGCSRAKASEMVSRELFGDKLTDLMLTPNNILALEYLKRIRWWEGRGRRAQAVPIRRHGSGYTAANPEEGYAGGSAIRQMIMAGQDVTGYLGYGTEDLAWEDLPAVREHLYGILRGSILRSSDRELANIYCVGEGMEHRLGKMARSRETYEDFLSSMVSRRYTASAIRRIMLYLLMNIDEMPASAPYGRVLAASGTGRRLLRRIRAEREDTGQGLLVLSGNVPEETLDPDIAASIRLDELAADMYNLICGRSPDQYADGRRHPYIEGA